jgi:hypothetical protein
MIIRGTYYVKEVLELAKAIHCTSGSYLPWESLTSSAQKDYLDFAQKKVEDGTWFEYLMRNET